MGGKSYVSTLARDYLYDFRLLMKQNVSSVVIPSFKQRGIKELFDSTKTLFLSTELF